MISLISFLFLICLLEAYIASQKIFDGVSPLPMYLLRIVGGLGFVLVYWALFKPFLFPVRELAYLSVFAVSFYWTMFDGFLNLLRGINWFKWGKTKKIDRFFGSHSGLVLLGHFIKWNLILIPFFSILLPRIH